MRTSWFKSLKAGLSKTSARFSSSVRSLLGRSNVSSETMEQLEDLLLTSDIGVAATASLLESVKRAKPSEDPDFALRALAAGISQILTPCATELQLTAAGPTVILMCGVNGNGKTTTIAKLAHLYQTQGKRVMLAACDTFRAAASEQLAIWAGRIKVTCVQGAEREDPASVAFRALSQAIEQQVDVLLIDTAGRLHTQHNLMAELGKITGVLKKLVPAAPHHCILVIDATTGQNAFRQVAAFQKEAGISGLIISKLDGSARGGVVVGLAKEFALPIHFIGLGESLADLQPFVANDFTELLLGLEIA